MVVISDDEAGAIDVPPGWEGGYVIRSGPPERRIYLCPRGAEVFSPADICWSSHAFFARVFATHDEAEDEHERVWNARNRATIEKYIPEKGDAP